MVSASPLLAIKLANPLAFQRRPLFPPVHPFRGVHCPPSFAVLVAPFKPHRMKAREFCWVVIWGKDGTPANFEPYKGDATPARRRATLRAIELGHNVNPRDEHTRRGAWVLFFDGAWFVSYRYKPHNFHHWAWTSRRMEAEEGEYFLPFIEGFLPTL